MYGQAHHFDLPPTYTQAQQESQTLPPLGVPSQNNQSLPPLAALIGARQYQDPRSTSVPLPKYEPRYHHSSAQQLQTQFSHYQISNDRSYPPPTLYPSPRSSPESTKSDGELLYTPVSRANSPNHEEALNRALSSISIQQRRESHQHRRDSKIAIRRDSHRDSATKVETRQDKKNKKMEKEKQCRGDQAAVLCRIEDAFNVYCGWERREQSGGNGNGAGLQTNKINLLQCVERYAELSLHSQYVTALQQGPQAVAEFQAGMRKLLDDAIDHDRPYQGTFLDAFDEQPCRNADPKSKSCVTHGTPDWRECRVSRAQYRFNKQEKQWLSSSRQSHM